MDAVDQCKHPTHRTLSLDARPNFVCDYLVYICCSTARFPLVVHSNLSRVSELNSCKQGNHINVFRLKVLASELVKA